MDKRVRAAQRERAISLRGHGLTWVEISHQLRAEWPQLNPRAALRIAHGWTQRQAADEWNRHWPDRPKTDNEIGLMENRRLGLDTLGKLAWIYQCAVADLIDDIDNYRHLDANAAPDDGRGAVRVPIREQLTEQWDAHASETIADLLTEAEASTTPVDDLIDRTVHQWLITPPPQTVELCAGRRIGEGLVDKLEQRIAQLRHLDDFVGGRDLQVLVDNELELTSAVLSDASYTDALGRRMLGAIGELSWLAGWVAADAGDHHRAMARYATGIKAAHAAGDRQGAANLISSIAYHLTNRGRTDDAVTAARSALAGVDDSVSPTVRALLGERLAWAHANVGNVAQTEAALYGVDLDYDSREPQRDPEWIYWLDRDEIDVMAARCMVVIGRPERAVELLTGVLGRYNPNKTRELALYTSTLAEAHLDAGNIDEAAMVALRAAELTGQTSSARSDERVQSLVARLREFDGVAAVRDFLDAAS